MAAAKDPKALTKAFAELPWLEDASSPGRGGRQGDDPQRHPRRSADRARGELRQPAPALHRLGAPQRGDAHRRRQARAPRERVRRRRRQERQDSRLRHRGGGLRAARDAVHRARAARGPRRARCGQGGKAPEAGQARRHPRRPAHAHHGLGRPQHRPSDGQGGGRRAGWSTSRSPTTRRATASATT